jgi:hypothetical protein
MTGGWQMTTGYKAWLIIGMMVIVTVMVSLGLAQPSNKNLVFVALVLVGIYLAGIFYFQFRSVDRIEAGAVGASTDAGKADASGETAAPGDNPPSDWQAMMRALAVKPMDAASQRAATGATTGIVRSQLKYGVLLCAAILIGMALFYGGIDAAIRPFGESGPGFPVALAPVFVLIAYGVLRIPFTLAAAQGEGDAYLEPLGLRITEMPRVGVRPRLAGGGMQTDMSGPTVMSGERHGHRVEVRLEARDSHTLVSVSTPTFEVAAKDGRLVAGKRAPATVRESVEALGPDKRWKNVEVIATADGIAVDRRLRTSQQAEQLWMTDLWLAERLADAVGG